MQKISEAISNRLQRKKLGKQSKMEKPHLPGFGLTLSFWANSKLTLWITLITLIALIILTLGGRNPGTLGGN